MIPRVPLGIHDFRALRRDRLEYVDKSDLIRALLDRPGVQVSLLPRPRRFGKTLNLSMLRFFFEKRDEDVSDLFEGQIQAFVILALTAASLTAGCMNLMPPPSAGGAPTDPAAGGPGAGEPGGQGFAVGEPAPGGGEQAADKPPVPTTVEIKSECSNTVPVFYGEKPKFGSGKKSSVSGNSTSSEGRKADGTLTVWIIDDQENGVASAKVTPETKRVIIDRSCTSIRAE